MFRPLRTGGRVVDGTALEMRRPFTGFVGSNPTLSASFPNASAQNRCENLIATVRGRLGTI